MNKTAFQSKIWGQDIAHVSHAQDGHVAGLQPNTDRLDCYFDYLRIGYIDLHVIKLQAVVNQKKKERNRYSSGRPAARRSSRGAAETQVCDGQSTQKVLPMS